MSVKPHSLFLFLLLLAAGQTNHAQKSLRIVFAGDVMGHDSQINAAYIDSSDSYDYRTCFSYLKPYLEQTDMAVANLEVTLAGHHTKATPVFPVRMPCLMD